jgi:hypothetical protein
MLAALAVQWLTLRVSARPASAPAVVVAGADEIARPHRMTCRIEAKPPKAHVPGQNCSPLNPKTFIRPSRVHG